MTRQEWEQEHGWSLPREHTPERQLKPSSCQGCPLHERSKWYVPDEIHPKASVLILMQNPGADEERLGVPACGKTGELLNKRYLPLAGLRRGQVSVANVLKCRLGNTNDLPTGETLAAAVKHCTEAHLRIPDSVDTIIVQGQLALDYATTTDITHSVHNINDWRGFCVTNHGTVETLHRSAGRRLFVTSHIAANFHDPTLSWVSELDWRRAGRLLNGRYPAPHPRWTVARSDCVDPDTISFFTSRQPRRHAVIDTEYIPAGSHLTVLGILVRFDQDYHGRVHTKELPGITHKSPTTRNEGTSDGDTAVLSVDWQNASPVTRDYIRFQLGKLVRETPCVFHNAMADIPVLEKAMGITYADYKRIDDTMLAHAILWCELPHDLEFLASIYGNHEKFKHLKADNELLYNYGDVVDTDSVWMGLQSGFAADAQARSIYESQSLALLPTLLEARQQGIRVNKQRVVEVFQEYYSVARRVKQYVELMTGYEFNLNSGAQLKQYCYLVKGYPVQRDKDTKQLTTNDDAINRLRAHVLPFDAQKELTFDRDDDKHYSVLRRVELGADPVLECRALWGECWHTVNNYIIGLCKGVYGEFDKTKKKKTREQYWREGIRDESIVDRIYPNFAIHAQKTGRWSTTEPPLAQLPADLRDIICPDEDEVCISWDWSAIEPRVLQALTGSQLLKKTFDENFDLHTWTVCYMFGYDFPPDLVDPHRSPSCEAWRKRYNWKGKDDPRRVFAKQGRYEMWYGGTGSNAAQAAASFGLDAKALKIALGKLATSDPAYYAWKVKTESEVKQTAMIRTFMGRPRRFLSSGDSRRREGLDQPMQGAVSDIFNTTIVQLKNQFPFLRWGWGMHDSQKWYVSRARLTQEMFSSIRAIVERTHTIAGQVTRFPGDFEIIEPPERGNSKSSPQHYFSLAT